MGPAVLPSAQIRLGIASVGPHLLGSHVGALASAAVGGRRQFVASHRASAGQSESVLQTPRAGSQRQGPPQTSFLSQTSASPSLQVGVVQPQLRASVVTPVAGSITASQGHW